MRRCMVKPRALAHQEQICAKRLPAIFCFAYSYSYKNIKLCDFILFCFVLFNLLRNGQILSSQDKSSFVLLLQLLLCSLSIFQAQVWQANEKGQVKLYCCGVLAPGNGNACTTTDCGRCHCALLQDPQPPKGFQFFKALLNGVTMALQDLSCGVWRLVLLHITMQGAEALEKALPRPCRSRWALLSVTSPNTAAMTPLGAAWPRAAVKASGDSLSGDKFTETELPCYRRRGKALLPKWNMQTQPKVL